MNRIAVLSDVHGNIWALEAVLEDVRRLGADLVVNAGDVLSGPLEPSATADLLMGLGLPTVAGNHERQLLACEAAPGGLSDQHAFERTTPRQREWLRGLPLTLELAPDVLMCHGTPASDRTHFLEEPDGGRLRLADAGAIEARAEGVPHALVVCGHSHVPRAYRLRDGRLVVNPGSVGLQAYDDDHPAPYVTENGSPHARWALCERSAAGWSVAFRSVAYDFRDAAATARRNGREVWARALETGRV